MLRKFIELYEDHPRHAQAILGLGTLLEESGNLEAAESRYREIITLHPDSELALMQRFGSAISSGRKVMEKKPALFLKRFHLRIRAPDRPG